VLIFLTYVVCVALRLARFNVNSESEPSWRDNFFEGVPSPAGGVLVLMPLIYNLSEFTIISLNYSLVVPIFFVMVSLLLISKVPTYSLKKISVPSNMTIFLVLSIILYFGLILVYTFNAIIISGIVYLIIIPFSIYHYLKIKNKFKLDAEHNDSHEDIL